MSRKSLPVLNASKAAPAGSGGAGAGGAEGDGEGNGLEPSILIWTSVGIVAAFVLWLPLAALAGKLGVRLLPQLAGSATPEEIARSLAALPPAEQHAMQLRLALPQLAAFLLAHVGAGALVAKFGTLTTLRAWLVVGLATGGLAAALTLASGTISPLVLVPIPLAAAASAGGGWLARRLAS